HDHGWRLTLDPDDASLTIQRCQTTLHTHARAERTLRAPPPPRRPRRRRTPSPAATALDSAPTASASGTVVELDPADPF
ncbi:MAG: hypothetical protein ACR2MA_11025, partial [Egibacteraceae bacterium]